MFCLQKVHTRYAYTKTITTHTLSNCAVISLVRFIVDHKLYIFNPCFFATSVYDSFQFDADPRSTLGKNGSRSRFFFLNLLNFFNKLEFSNFLSIFSLIFMLKLDEPSRNKEIFIISLFLNSSDLGFESKHFFCSFWLIFCPGFLDLHIFADPDLDTGSKKLANPTYPDPDSKHCLQPRMLESFLIPKF